MSVEVELTVISLMVVLSFEYTIGVRGFAVAGSHTFTALGYIFCPQMTVSKYKFTLATLSRMSLELSTFICELLKADYDTEIRIVCNSLPACE